MHPLSKSMRRGGHWGPKALGRLRAVIMPQARRPTRALLAEPTRGRFRRQLEAVCSGAGFVTDRRRSGPSEKPLAGSREVRGMFPRGFFVLQARFAARQGSHPWIRSSPERVCPGGRMRGMALCCTAEGDPCVATTAFSSQSFFASLQICKLAEQSALLCRGVATWRWALNLGGDHGGYQQ